LHETPAGAHRTWSSHGSAAHQSPSAHRGSLTSARPPLRVPRVILITASVIIVALLAVAYAVGSAAR